jgi:hypothetical protein
MTPPKFSSDLSYWERQTLYAKQLRFQRDMYMEVAFGWLCHRNSKYMNTIYLQAYGVPSGEALGHIFEQIREMVEGNPLGEALLHQKYIEAVISRAVSTNIFDQDHGWASLAQGRIPQWRQRAREKVAAAQEETERHDITNLHDFIEHAGGIVLPQELQA